MFQDRFPWTNIHELNLDWILKHFREFLVALDELEDWKTQHESEYEELKALVEKIEKGILPDSVYDRLKAWFIANYKDILGEFIKFISVKINDGGYLVIEIPESLHDIVFNTTGLDIFTPLQPEYGHLTISY